MLQNTIAKGQLGNSVDCEPGLEIGGPKFQIWPQTLPSCVSLGKSLDSYCLPLPLFCLGTNTQY